MIRLYTFVGCRDRIPLTPCVASLQISCRDSLSSLMLTIILVTTDSSPSPDYQSEMNLTHKIFSREIHSAPPRATGCRLEPSHVSNEEILSHSAQRMPLQRLLCNVPVANEFHCRERSANSPVGFCSEQPPEAEFTRNGEMWRPFSIRVMPPQRSHFQTALIFLRFNVFPAG